MKNIITSLFVCLFLLSATSTFANNDVKRKIEAAVEQINANKKLSDADKTKFTGRFNVLLKKIETKNDAETLELIEEEYTRLAKNYTRVTGSTLSLTETKN